MEIRTWRFGPAEGETDAHGRPKRWTFEDIEAYHRQCIAVSLDQLVSRINNQSDVIERLHREKHSADDAVQLMIERETVVGWFAESGSMPLGKFVELWRRSFGWAHLGATPAVAINKTNYLVAEPRGSGYRVRLLPRV